jgi:hypothetical protein
MDYQDRFGFWNVKPVNKAREPSGNDGAIITAYARKAGLGMDWPNLWHTRDLVDKKNGIPVQRHPGKYFPPPSRDTMLGLVAIGMLHPETLVENGWSFSPFKIPSFNLFKSIAAFWRLRTAHRNAVWMDKGEPHVFRFAFSVPLPDRAFMLRTAGMKVGFIYGLAEWIDKKFTTSSSSSTLIRWLKYEIKPEASVFEEYFGKEHPITLKMRSADEVYQ